jgi:hypothetical protein
MANETTYDIKVDSADAQAKLDKLVASLKEAKKYADSIGDGFRNIGKFNAPIPGSASGGASNDNSDSGPGPDREFIKQHKRDEKNYFKDFKDYNKNFKPYAAEMKQFTRGVMGLGTNLLKFAAGGALGAAAGIVGVISPLARSAVEDRRQALALGGANVGKMKAAPSVFGTTMPGIRDMTASIAQGQSLYGP